jgi:transposase
MIQIPVTSKIFIMHEAISFRNSFDGTIAIVKHILNKDSMDGSFFVFRSKQGHSLRILYYDGSGYWLSNKRLSKGSFKKIWPSGDKNIMYSTLLVRELQILLWGGNPFGCRFPKLWRAVA